jgi:hypothetical protein
MSGSRSPRILIEDPEEPVLIGKEDNEEENEAKDLDDD